MCDGSIRNVPDGDLCVNAALKQLRLNPSAICRECTISRNHSTDECTFGHIRTYRLKRRDVNESMVELPATRFVENPALKCLRNGTVLIGSECSKGDVCTDKSACSSCHIMEEGSGKNNKKRIAFVGVVVDGYSFSKQYGLSVASFEQLVSDITRHISHAAMTEARVHREAKVILFPSPWDALERNIITEGMLVATTMKLDKLRKEGWKVLHTDFKMVGDSWKATAEDVAFANECARLCARGALDPIGATPARVTLSHLVIATGDNDHYSTFCTQSNRELRWLVDMNPNLNPNQRLRRAATEVERVVVFTAPPLVSSGSGGSPAVASPSPLVSASPGRLRPVRRSPPSSSAVVAESVEQCQGPNAREDVTTEEGETPVKDAQVVGVRGLLNARRQAPRDDNVPDGFVLCSGDLVADEQLEDNAGKAKAIQTNHRRGLWCKYNTSCTFGVNCSFLHRRKVSEQATDS